MNKEDILKACTVNGTTVNLPEGQLYRKLYVEVAKALELIGGKWKGGKVAGFVFDTDPTELLAQIANGDKRNTKKEFQFFATPDILADKLVKYADIKADDTVLEPSAGQGALVHAIHRVWQHKTVWCYELMPVNQKILEGIAGPNNGGAVLLGDDFLECDGQFDKILANPPFHKNYDVIHIRKMYDCLKPGGRLVSVASKHWQNSNNKVETEFRNWLTDVGAVIGAIPANTFKESGTSIETVTIIIDKK